MPEEEKDVTSAPSPEPETPETPEIDVDQAEESSASAPQPSGEDVTTAEPVDDRGVPLTNVREEVKRKVLEEMQPYITQQIQEGIQRQQQTAHPTQTQTSQAQPQYTLEQLDALEDQYPDHRTWIRQERTRMLKEEAKKEALDALRQETGKQTVAQEQQQALSAIEQDYGDDAFISTPNGKQWNALSPLYQRAVQIYQSRPSFRNDGLGLKGAFDMAYGQLAREDRLNTTKQKTKLTAQQRRQEKNTHTAMNSGGKAPAKSENPSKAKLAKLMDEHKRTGDPKLFNEIIRMKGLMPADIA